MAANTGSGPCWRAKSAPSGPLRGFNSTFQDSEPVVGYRRPAGRSGLVVKQALKALRHEPRLPAPNRGLRLSRHRHNTIRADAGGAQQHDLGAPDMFLRDVAARNESVEPLTVSLDNRDPH
jgi:hypothetical protein